MIDIVNSLQQYIDLYNNHRELIDSNSAPVLNRRRGDALAALTGAEGNPRELPRLRSENYEITDLSSMLGPDYGLNVARVPIEVNPSSSFRCGVPNLSTALFLNLNDSPAESDVARRSIPEGVIIGSLRKAAAEHPDLVERFYGRAASLENPLVALDTLLAQDGFFLYVPRGVKLEKPVQLVNILANGAPLMAVRRVLIVLEEDAEARILVCDHTQNPDVDFLSLQTIEIFAGVRSRLDLYDLEESSERTGRLSTLYLRQEAGANVLLDGITLFNGHSRNEYHCSLVGREAELKLLGMAITDRSRVADTLSFISHDAPSCHTDELFKYVVDDSSRGAFAGRIYVADGASGTEAYQSNRNILGSPEARMYSKPQLEIYNDDVKCSHGSATGQLDPMQLFYMRTRGLSEASARLLLKQAFMADVIDAVRLPRLKERLHSLVERRLSGTLTLCSDCADCAASLIND